MSQFPDLFEPARGGGLPFDLGGSPLLDAPGVLIDNVIRGRLLEAGFNPATMAPQDRASLADRIKNDLPDLPLAGAIVEVALNPWVWLGIGLSVPFKLPPMGKTFEPGLRSLAGIRKQSPFLSRIGLLGSTEELQGTSLLRVLDQIEQRAVEFQRKGLGVQSERDALVGRLGLASVSDDPKLAAAIQAKLHGLDQKRMQTSLVVEGTGKNLSWKIREVEAEAILDSRKLNAYIREKGAEPLVAEIQKAYASMYGELFGDEEKILRIARGVRKGIDNRTADKLSGNPLAHLFSKETMEALAKGELSEDTFRQYVRQLGARQDYYAPLNTRTLYVKEGAGIRKINRDEAMDAFERRRNRTKSTGRPTALFERQGDPNLFDPDDLENLRDLGNSNFDKKVRQARTARQKIADELEDRDVMGMPSLDVEAAYNRYVGNGSITYAAHVSQPDDTIIRAQNAYRERIREGVAKGLRPAPDQGYDGPLGQRVGRSVGEAVGGDADAPPGGWSLWDAARGDFALIDPGDRITREHITNVTLPVIFGRQSIRQGALTGAMIYTKETLRSFLESPAIQNVPWSGAGKKIHDGLLQWAKTPLRDPLAADRATARYLYGSTLGINMGSVTLNMLQPLITLTRVMSPADVAMGYKDAIEDMARYANERMRHFSKHGFTRRGLLIGPEHEAEKAILIRKSFKFADAAEIGPSIQDTIDAMNGPLNRQARVGVLGKVDDVTEFVLKSFEKGEWINRSVTANAVARAARRSGGLATPDLEFAVREMVERTQFGASRLNTPIIFQDQDGPLAGLAANPLFRQFLTFPTRIVTGLERGRQIGGGGFREALAADGLGDAMAKIVMSFRDVGRAMAASAIVYEVGKEVFGADLTPGTLIGATAGLYRTQGLFAPLPAPPAFTLPASVVQYLTTGEQDALRYSLPLLVPGGVSLSKTLGLLPEVPGPMSVVQRTFVDWNTRTEDGRYPVYDPDGRLISYESAPAITAKALGLDFGRFRDEGEMIGYLTKIREESIEYRRRYLRAATANDVSEMQRVAAEYERKFGLRLTVNEAQLRAYRESLDVSRVERSIENLPRELRERFVPPLAQEMGGRLGVPPERFAEALTISRRDQARFYTAEIPTEAQAELVRREGTDREGFQPFTPYGVR